MTDYLMETLMVKKTQSLDELAKQITQYSKEADGSLLKAAALLQEVRSQLETQRPGASDWTEWAEQNLDIRESRRRQLLRIAEAADPAEELKRQREQTRKRVARHRGKEKQKAAALRSAALTVASDLVKTTEIPGPPQTRQADLEQPQPDQRRKTELERSQLIEWAGKASPDHVRQTWRFAGKLAGGDSDRTPPSATKPAAISAQEAVTTPAVH